MNEITPELIDGSPVAKPAEVLGSLDALNIVHRTIQHPPMFTVDDAIRLRGNMPGGHAKNLFLKNRKGKMWLVVMHEAKRADLSRLGVQLESGKLGFASEQRLMHYLGVYPGAVTPLSVINDRQHQVTVVIEESLLALDPLHFHPCDNAMTTTLSAESLLRYLEAHNHSPVLMDLDGKPS